MADDSLSIEISARDLTGSAFDGVRRQLDALNQSSEKTARGVSSLSGGAEKMAGLFKGAGIAAAIGVVVNKLIDYHDATRVATAAIADQAETLQKSAAQFQAYIFAGDQVGLSQEKVTGVLSRFQAKMGEAAQGNKSAIEAFGQVGVKLLDVNGRLRDENSVLADTAAALLRMENASQRAAAAKDLMGLSGARLTPFLRQLAGGFGDVMERAEKAGVVIDERVVAMANKLENQSNQTSMAVRKFYAEIGMPIELRFLEALEKTVNRITRSYLNASDAFIKFDASTTNAGFDSKIAGLDKKIASAQSSLDSPSWVERQLRSEGSEAAIRRDIAGYQQERERLVAEKAKVDERLRAHTASREGTDRGRNVGLVDWVPDTGAGGSMPGVKSSGGGDKRDRIGEAINQLIGERIAAENALKRMVAGAGMPLKDLEQQVALEKKIADEIAKLGKYDPKDPRVQQIRDQVIAHEQAESALKRWSQAARDAEEVERRSGDGTAYLRTEMQRLNEALDTGRLSYSAYGEAARLANEKAVDMRLQLQGQKGGVEGLVAGMQYAANQWERNNRAFQVGGRMYEKVIADMTTLTNSFGQSFEQTALQIALSWAQMFAELEMRAAMSSIWSMLGGKGGGGGDMAGGILTSIIGGVIGGFGGDVTAGAPLSFGPGGSGMAGAASLPGGWMPGFAGGGETPVNRPFWVGERGPELMQMGTPGHVWNQDQLSGMGGGPVINIYNTNQFGSVVSRAEMEQIIVRNNAEQRSVMTAAVLDAKSRGGAYRTGMRR